MYPPEKANVVVDALSRKVVGMGGLEFIHVGKRWLASNVQALANQFVRERQYDDPHLPVLKDSVQHSDAKEDNGVLQMQGQICVANVDGLPWCLNFQQVKYEHQWERITKDFVVRLQQTSRKFDAIWAIVDRLIKSVHFIQVGITYYLELLAEIYICKIVHLRGVPVSIISEWDI
ncbi:uncharacterized protein [Nicotiana sylvestris]|uniref:uncharacterized protein n=1 Tax=Nicotiana sylvestris TaxID=4096 RepID=UPI00388C7BDA